MIKDAVVDPALALSPVSPFSDDLKLAAQFVYDNYLKNDYKRKMGLEDDEPYAGVCRPNHGLAHVMRQAYYVPFVLKFLNHFQGSDACAVYQVSQRRINTLQLKLLFAGCGRENEASNLNQDPYFGEVGPKSSQALRYFVNDHVPRGTWDCTVGINDNNATSIIWGDCECFPSCKFILNICHALDSMRWNRNFDPASSMMTPTFVKDHALVQFALQCVLATGDRVVGLSAHERMDDIFSQCSTNVDFCLQRLGSVAEPVFPATIECSSHGNYCSCLES